MNREPQKPTVICTACGGEGIGGEYVPELCGEGEDQGCATCEGSGRVDLPSKYEVCPQCEGKGTSSAYLGAFTASEWAEHDDEFKEDYIAGRYDRACETCKGLRVVLVPDESQCDPKQLEAYYKELADEAADRRTRAMESGWGYDSGCGF